MSDQIKNTPDYGTPEAVLAAVELMQQPERIRASNRALINSLMNGRRPYTDAEVAEHQIQINVNWGEGSKILQDANRQINNALPNNKRSEQKRNDWCSNYNDTF